MRLPIPEHYLITPEPAAYGRAMAAQSAASSSTTPIIGPAATHMAYAERDKDGDGADTAAEIDVSAHRFLIDLDASLSAGIKLVQLRSKLLTPRAFAALAKQAAALCHRAGARLIVNGALKAWGAASGNVIEGDDTGTIPTSVSNHALFYMALQAEIDALDADGVHLSSAQLMRCSQRPLRHGQWVSAACHTSAELQQAMTLQLDFVTLSPVLHTTTHPDAEPLGWERFAALARTSHVAALPIFALGGMQAADMASAQAHGAHGIAAIRSFWLRKSH